MCRNYNLTPLMAVHNFRFHLQLPGFLGEMQVGTGGGSTTAFLPGRGEVACDGTMTSIMEETNLANIGVGMERFIAPGRIFRDGSFEERARISEALVRLGADVDHLTNPAEYDKEKGKQSAAAIIQSNEGAAGAAMVARLRKLQGTR